MVSAGRLTISMTSAQSKRQKLAASSCTNSSSNNTNNSSSTAGSREATADGDAVTANGSAQGASATASASAAATATGAIKKTNNIIEANNFGVDVDDLTDDTDSDENDDDDLADDDTLNGDKLGALDQAGNHVDIQEQLAAAGPAGVAAAAAIATARKRKRPHTFETNPSVRKRQQTRLIRKLRACIDEYTMRVGQQAVVLITMPGKAVHNFKVFGAQPLESVIRTCKHEIMSELEQALLEQAPQQFKEDANKHELPPLVIDGIPTPVEKMTQAQLRAFIPLMLKYSTGRGKPGWGKDTTRPPWWPETLPWANVRSDARDESEKQRISWTTTLRQIVTNCYKFHGRDDLLPTFDENEAGSLRQEQDATAAAVASSTGGLIGIAGRRLTSGVGGSSSDGHVLVQTAFVQQQQHQHQQASTRAMRQQMTAKAEASCQQQQLGLGQAGTTTTTIYSAAPAYASNFVHTIANSDGTVSLIQMDPANAQILTLPDGTQVRAVRLQTLGADSLCGQQLGELHETSTIELAADPRQQHHQQQHHQQQQQQQQQMQAVSVNEASMGADGQIIVTGEDGVQSCYPMSSLVSIPASMYQQFAQGGQQLSIVTADGTTIPANAAISIHSIQDPNELLQQQQQQQQQEHQDHQEHQEQQDQQQVQQQQQQQQQGLVENQTNILEQQQQAPTKSCVSVSESSQAETGKATQASANRGQSAQAGGATSVSPDAASTSAASNGVNNNNNSSSSSSSSSSNGSQGKTAEEAS